MDILNLLWVDLKSLAVIYKHWSRLYFYYLDNKSNDRIQKLDSSPKIDFAKYKSSNFAIGFSQKVKNSYMHNHEYMDSLQRKLKVN